MNFFRLIAEHIDVKRFLAEIEAQPDAWLAHTSRQDRIDIHRPAQSIFLRGGGRRPDLNVNENQESAPTAMAAWFPLAMAFFERIAQAAKGILSCVVTVRLKPGGRVGLHIDAGSYYRIRDRYHLVLQSCAGSLLRAGGEESRMCEGKPWWFDNKQHHDAANESDDWPIHFIFDLLSPAYARLVVNAAAAQSTS